MKKSIFIYILVGLLLPLSIYPKTKTPKFEIAAVAIFRDEARFLSEWIEYHRLIGIEHFYLYNHLSNDHYEQILSKYIHEGIVELIEWPHEASNWGEWDKIQIQAYRNALKRAKYQTKWLAILDIDEFVVPVRHPTLHPILKKCEKDKLGGICAMWSFFGTSNVEKIPQDKLLIETLVLHTGPAANGDVSNVWNQGAYKSIVQPEYVDEIVSPHYCHYKKGRKHQMLSYQLIHINHYWTRDNHFFMNVKIPRREAWGQERESAISWAQGMNGWTENNPILRFVNPLRTIHKQHQELGIDRKSPEFEPADAAQQELR